MQLLSSAPYVGQLLLAMLGVCLTGGFLCVLSLLLAVQDRFDLATNVMWAAVVLTPVTAVMLVFVCWPAGIVLLVFSVWVLKKTDDDFPFPWKFWVRG